MVKTVTAKSSPAFLPLNRPSRAGFRAGDQTDELAERVRLGAPGQDRVERTNLRSGGFERRRALADAWAAHCGTAG
jgi:hypothetical protein